MNKMQVVSELKNINAEMQKDGIVILGIFGSVARGMEGDFSDIDILYDAKEGFFEKFGGFGSFIKLDEIQNELSLKLGVKVDLVCKKGLPESSLNEIKKEMVYV